MLADVINGAIGLIVGLALGFFFERRAGNSARRENTILKKELRTVRESVYTVGGQRSVAVQPAMDPEDLRTQVRRWLEERQDAEGRVLLAQVISEFVAQGHGLDDIEAAITDLSRMGDVEREGRWVRVR